MTPKDNILAKTYKRASDIICSSFQFQIFKESPSAFLFPLTLSSTPLWYWTATGYQICSCHLEISITTRWQSVRKKKRGPLGFLTREQDKGHVLFSCHSTVEWLSSLILCSPSCQQNNNAQRRGIILSSICQHLCIITYLHMCRAWSIGANTIKLPAFISIKITHKHIRKQTASAHVFLLGTWFCTNHNMNVHGTEM